MSEKGFDLEHVFKGFQCTFERGLCRNWAGLTPQMTWLRGVTNLAKLGFYFYTIINNFLLKIQLLNIIFFQLFNNKIFIID